MIDVVPSTQKMPGIGFFGGQEAVPYHSVKGGSHAVVLALRLHCLTRLAQSSGRT